MLCNHEVCCSGRWIVPVVLELLIWDYKWGRRLEGCFSNPYCRCFGACHPTIGTLTSCLRKGRRIVFSTSPLVKEDILGPKALGGIELPEAILSFSGLSLSGCNSIQLLCQLVLKSTEQLCMYCCCWGMWNKTWTLKPAASIKAVVW